jgi:hypothetical protein
LIQQRPHQPYTNLQQQPLADIAGKRDKNSSPQYATSHQLCTKLQQHLLGDVAGKKRKKIFSAIHNVPISFVLNFNSIFWETLLGRNALIVIDHLLGLVEKYFAIYLYNFLASFLS